MLLLRVELFAATVRTQGQLRERTTKHSGAPITNQIKMCVGVYRERVRVCVFWCLQGFVYV